MKTKKKMLTLLLAIVLIFSFSVPVMAEEPKSDSMQFEEIILDEESLRAGTVVVNVEVDLDRYEGRSYSVYPPANYDVEIYFTQGTDRFAVELSHIVGGRREMTVQKVFIDQRPPMIYRDNGWSRGSSTQVLIFNDGSGGGTFVGTVSFIPR